jgi:hypothetical protein
MNDNFNTRMILTTAVFAAVAALLVGPASAQAIDEGWDGGRTSVTAPPTIQPGTIPYLSHGIGVDESQFSGTPERLDPSIRAAILARESERNVERALTEKGPIPYQFQGEQQSLGLTGDSPITRIVGQEPAGLTGDSPRTRGQVFQANASLASNGDTDINWTWVGFGAGMAALLAAAMGALYLSARHRDRVALP